MRDSLAGRASELAVLREALDRRADGAVVIGICGDPGIGKTRLLGELAAEARRRGCPVLAGRAAEFEREVPFGTIRNALADHVDARAAGLSPAPAAADLQLLRTVFPDLTPETETGEPALLASERYRVHRAVRALLEGIAAGHGLVLVLDDLHWSDTGSVELLDHLLRHPPRGGVLLALAYRPRQVPAMLSHAMSAAVQRGLATVVTVGPLSFAEAAPLLPAEAGPRWRRKLYDASAGNPFHLELLARGAATDGTAPPPDVASAMAGEFATLDTVRRQVLHAAAVTGDTTDPGLLAAVAELPLRTVLAALDDLTTRDLLRPAGFGGAVHFRHPLLRSAAYHDAGPGWRVAAHARAAAELRRRKAPLADQAVHVHASATLGDLAAVELLRAAAAEALRVTPAAAAHWLRAALSLLPRQDATIPTRMELLHLRAEALGITGQLTEARSLLNELLGMLPPGSEPRARVVSFLCALQHLLGDHEEAHALVVRELDALSDPRGMAAGTLRVALALTTLMTGTAGEKEVADAIDTARLTGNRPLLAASLGVGVAVSHAAGPGQENAAVRLDEATAMVDAMPDHELAERLDAALFLGWGELYLERYAQARRHLRRALRVARATGQSHLIGSLQTIEGVVHCCTGDLREALPLLDDALESVTLTGGPDGRARVQGYRCWGLVWTGDLDGALAAGTEAESLGPGHRDWQSASADGMLGWARYAAGDPEGCLDLMLTAGEGADLRAVRPLWRPRWFEVLCAAAAATGDRRLASELAAGAARLSVGPAYPRHAGMVAMAQTHAVLSTDPRAAAGHAGRAAALFARAGDHLGVARARLYLAAAYRDTVSPARAGREIKAAQSEFARCGARPQWLFRITGIPLDPADPAEPADPGIRRLTPREMDVLALLAESLTAASIGRRLGISTGTVHKHLAALYRKLGTGDRLATVLRARTLGLLPDAGG
ncbi:AAA family ATPase [Actinoplanes sp. NPDC051346]|uniref:helix-turn-helix transcriptional regulator n=1 Tax=Actinoplanes sp. NPDC051346 TaxID=3155048 RepID=UPI003439F7A8